MVESLILFIVFGILPSITWLSYYLRKDVHPESNKMVLVIFLWGAVITLPVFFVQIGLSQLLAKLNLPPALLPFLYWFLVIAFTEELFKYLVVKTNVLNSSELDEPLDIMLYMIITALGFAALENILYLFSPFDKYTFFELLNRTLVIGFVRFVGATFLHTLCSGLLGYFMAKSIYEAKNKIWLFALGLFLATLLHGLYDFSIMTFEGIFKFVVPIIILVGLAFFVMFEFKKIKKIKSICKL